VVLVPPAGPTPRGRNENDQLRTSFCVAGSDADKLNFAVLHRNDKLSPSPHALSTSISLTSHHLSNLDIAPTFASILPNSISTIRHENIPICDIHFAAYLLFLFLSSCQTQFSNMYTITFFFFFFPLSRPLSQIDADFLTTLRSEPTTV
jgi:hypothetical protein